MVLCPLIKQTDKETKVQKTDFHYRLKVQNNPFFNDVSLGVGFFFLKTKPQVVTLLWCLWGALGVFKNKQTKKIHKPSYLTAE